MGRKIRSSQESDYFARLKSDPNFRHFKKITTKYGMMQHSRGPAPDRRFGYCIDDNCRALIVAVLAYKRTKKSEFLNLSQLYLNFIEKMQMPDGHFHNFLSYNLKPQDEMGSEDSFGRTLWALGLTAYHKIDQKLTRQATQIFKKASKYVDDFTYFRPKSYILMGLYYFYKITKNEKYKKSIIKIADELVASFQENKSPRWIWFEDKMIYANAILPYVLMLAYEITKNRKYLKIGLDTFDFLLKTCSYKGKPASIGQKGWYEKDGARALYDQQQIETCDMVIASCKAYELSHKEKYARSSLEWMFWFWGNNLLGKTMIDPKSGGAYDGLKPNRRNTNQGAESTICYLIAYLTLKNDLQKFPQSVLNRYN